MIFSLAGNREFREIVAVAIPGYVAATSRSTKSEIVTDIVRQVRENGGRFLKRDSKRKVWYVLNYTQSKEKAGHAIRDATISEESKRERAQKRKLQRAAHTTEKNNGNTSPINLDIDVVSLGSQDDDCEKVMGPLSKEISGKSKKCDEDASSLGSLTSILMENFQGSFVPEDSSATHLIEPIATSFEPLPLEDSLPMDDPFNSYIDILLGPLTDF